jgi:LPXTG-site transpeptidase (sortase) family protein
MDQLSQAFKIAKITTEKLSQRGRFLKVVIIVFSLIGLLCFTQKQIQSITKHQQTTKQVLAAQLEKGNQRGPLRLQIPKIKVDAAIDSVGITSNGAMDVPGNTMDVGWYKFGPSPGDVGSAVITGHFDGKEGESGVFNNLDKLEPGDKIYIINNLGKTVTFVVRKRQLYNPGFADDIFESNDNNAHLNLVTCDGTWNIIKKSYTKRLVVFSDIGY